MNARVLTLGVVLVLLVGCSQESPVSVEGDGGPVPRIEFVDYLNTPLPAHFQTDEVQLVDNLPPLDPPNNWMIVLGRTLFYDTRLSSDRTVSCGTCHIQSRGFSDPAPVSTGVAGRRGNRHAVGLSNTRFATKRGALWDERARTAAAIIAEGVS